MKKSDQKMLLLAAAGVGGYMLYKKSKEDKDKAAVGMLPGHVGMEPQYVGATMPDWSIVPEDMRGKPSPLPLDIALWGLAGVAVGYYGLAGKKLPV